jgi:N-acetylmuramoyl-L-alanine amidase
MRTINKIIVHCTDTPEGRRVSVKDITQWHKEKGYYTIGYHYVVYLDGSVHAGRFVGEIGAHCKGHNVDSIGVCYVGGRDKKGDYSDTRTEAQKEALRSLIKKLLTKYPNAKVYGHRDFAARACPCFDAKTEYENV